MSRQKRRRTGARGTPAEEHAKRDMSRRNKLEETEMQTREGETKAFRKRAKMETFDENYHVDDVFMEDLVNDVQLSDFSQDMHTVGVGEAGPSSSSTGFLNLPGFRFSPKDDELIGYWLRSKCEGILIYDVISAVNLYAYEPWELPDLCKLGGGDVEWYFFTYRGAVTNRGTKAGYWKATGRDREIEVSGKRMGMKKTLVFYKGRAPNGVRTDWVMHEYRMDEVAVGRDSGWVVCRVTDKTGLPAQRNARQRGVGGSRVEEAYNHLHDLQFQPHSADADVNDDVNDVMDVNVGADTAQGHPREEQQKQQFGMLEDQAAIAPPPPPPPHFSTQEEEEGKFDVPDLDSVADEDGDFKHVFQAFHVASVENESPVAFPDLPLSLHGPLDVLLMGQEGGKMCAESATAGAAVTAGSFESGVFEFGGHEGPIDLDALADFEITPPVSPVVVVDDLPMVPAPAPANNSTTTMPAPPWSRLEHQQVCVDENNMVDLMGVASSPPYYDVGDDVVCTSESDGFVMIGDDAQVDELLSLSSSTMGVEAYDAFVDGLPLPPMGDVSHWFLDSSN